MSVSIPLFSVVIPTYNRADTLGKSIDSVMSQSFKDWEMIVVDDGSGDETEAMMTPYLTDRRINFFKQKNAGVSAARNTGAEKSSGTYLIFLDSDDEMAEGFMASANTIIKSSEGAGCFCFSTVFKRPGKTDNVLKPDVLGALFKDKKGLFLAGTFVIRRDAFIDLGGYDPELAFGENDELGQRICRDYQIVSSDVISLISHRVTKKEKNQRYRREVMAKTLSHYLRIYQDELSRIDQPRLISVNNRLAVCYFVMNEKKAAISILSGIIRKYPNVKSMKILSRIILFPGLYRTFLAKKGLV